MISWCRLFGCCFVLDVFRDSHVWRWSIFLFGEWRWRAYPYSTYPLWGWDIYVYILICILYIPFLFTPCVDGQYCLVVGAACLVWNKGNPRWGTKKDEPLFHNVLSLFWYIKTKLGRNNQPQTFYVAFPGGSLDFIQYPKLVFVLGTGCPVWFLEIWQSNKHVQMFSLLNRSLYWSLLCLPFWFQGLGR